MKIKKAFLLTALLFAVVSSGGGTTSFAADSAAGSAAAPEEKKPAKEAPKPYPLDVCIVTDNDLGSMGEETSMVYEGQTIKFCCAPCERKFLKNPAKYLEKLAPEKRK
ncbi:YHS domain-containing protein [Nibricoccus aquaticus]|nr:YHS domain-containing protein [Nibricoccus aquaticus]